MHPKLNHRKNEAGFSVIEMTIAITVMLVVTAGVFSLVKGSMAVATASYEMTDAQESLRTAQEYINRDLLNAGDGLKTISTIRVPQTFVTGYLTLAPIIDADMPTGIINLGILTTDNQVPLNTVVLGANPATTVRVDPGPDGILGTADDRKTDRQTILEIDSDFIPISPSSIDSTGVTVTLPTGTDMNLFTIGEIYCFSSSQGATFATVTDKNAGARTLTFANGDAFGLNLTGSNNNVTVISSNGTLATSLQRMKIIHYYVNSDGYLMRRVFGVKGTGFRDSVIAEHVMNVQFNYSLDLIDSAGNVVQPTQALSTKSERLGVRAVEVTVTVETPHALQNNAKTQLSMTTSTSVRNLQFRRAQQPS